MNDKEKVVSLYNSDAKTTFKYVFIGLGLVYLLNQRLRVVPPVVLCQVTSQGFVLTNYHAFCSHFSVNRYKNLTNFHAHYSLLTTSTNLSSQNYQSLDIFSWNFPTR